MPRVPRTDLVAVSQIATDRSPDQYQRTQASDFGQKYWAAVAQAGGQIAANGEEFYKVGEAVRQRDNILKAQEAALELDSTLDDFLHGENGYLRRRGTAATSEAGEEYARKMQEEVERRAGQAKDPDVARRIRSYGLSRLSRDVSTMGRHAAQQSFQATADLTETRLANTTNAAVAAKNAPEEFASAIEDGVDTLTTNAKLLGWSPEVLQGRINEFTSTVVAKTVDAFGETYDVEGAERFYREHREALSAVERDNVRAKIDSMERARTSEASRRRAEATAAREEYKRQTGNTFFSKLASHQLTAAEVMASDLPALGPGGKREWLQMIQEGATGKQQTNPAVFNELFRRVNLPEGDPQRITDPDALNQYLGAGLDYSSLNQLRGEFDKADPATAELRKNLVRTARNTLSGSNDLLGIKDPEGDAKFQAWLSSFIETEKKAKQSNDFGPAYYNPNRTDIYLGNSIQDFKRDDGDALRSQLDALDNPTAPGADIVDVKSPAEAAKLPKGTRFRTPDGRVLTRQ